jgi:hypothetical protein
MFHDEKRAISSQLSVDHLRALTSVVTKERKRERERRQSDIIKTKRGKREETRKKRVAFTIDQNRKRGPDCKKQVLIVRQ